MKKRQALAFIRLKSFHGQARRVYSIWRFQNQREFWLETAEERLCNDQLACLRCWF